jgi:glycosyltransferase involved in cell wall biosynthesis
LIGTKGIHVLVEAFTKHLAADKLSLLLICAPGPAHYEKHIKSLIKNDGRILLASPQHESVVLDSIRKAGAVVVPSLWPETGPYIVLEALYMGAKVIGANRAGIAERLAGVAGGFLYDPYDAGQLAAAIRQSQRENPTPGAPFNPLQYQSEYNSAVSTLLATVLPSGLSPDALADEGRQSGTPVVQ